jgi:hypothetical protein
MDPWASSLFNAVSESVDQSLPANEFHFIRHPIYSFFQVFTTAPYIFATLPYIFGGDRAVLTGGVRI